MLELSAGNEYDTSIGNESVDSIYIELELSHQFDDKISAFVGTGYEERDYSRINGDDYRSDDVYYLSAGGEYILIKDRLILDGKLYWSKQSSDQSTSEYDQTLARIGVRFIY